MARCPAKPGLRDADHWVTGIKGLEVSTTEFSMAEGLDGVDVDAFAIEPRGNDAAVCTHRGYIKAPAMSLFGDMGHVRYLQRLQKIQYEAIARVASIYLTGPD